MVLLTMTTAMAAVLQRHPELGKDAELHKSPLDPSLQEPREGKPISHGQILDIYKMIRQTRDTADDELRLQDLLRGANVYVPPAKPKPEPTPEYKELMARLRREEESRAYGKMVNASPDYKTPFDKFAAPNSAAAWDLQYPTTGAANDMDETTMTDVNRQLALIINVLVSIIACGIAVWLVLRHWDAPARLASSMACGAIVGVAEVAIYAAYVRKLGEARAHEKSKPETRSVADTWVIQATRQPSPAHATDSTINNTTARAANENQPRQRKTYAA